MRKKMNRFVFLWMIILLSLHFPLQSQYKWGEVSKELLALKSLPDDPGAAAMIVFNIGEMVISPQFSLKFSEPIKISGICINSAIIFPLYDFFCSVMAFEKSG